MSIVTQIYKAEPTYSHTVPSNIIEAIITVNGQRFIGTSGCAPDDDEFFSMKLGKQLALSRARISALQHFYEDTYKIYDGKYQLYNEIRLIPYEKNDLTFAYLEKNMWQITTQLDRLEYAIKKEEQHLKELIHDINDTFTRIRHHRILEQVKNEQKNRQNS